MGTLAEMREGRTTPQSVWMLFLGAYKEACLDLYLFFEGKRDFAFYPFHVRRKWKSQGEIHAFDCKGKKSVLWVMPKVKEKLDFQWRGLFFIDKDIDDICCGPKSDDPYVYTTDGYSIESHIVGKDVLKIVWCDLFSLPANDPRRATMLNMFDIAYLSFIETMKEVMSWVIAHRRNGMDVTLSDIKINKIITVNEDCSCTLIADWKSRITINGTQPIPLVSCDIHDAVRKELSGLEPKIYIRGKFELWFFTLFVNKTYQIVNTNDQGQERAKCSIQLQESNILEYLAPRIDAPHSLENFLSTSLKDAAGTTEV